MQCSNLLAFQKFSILPAILRGLFIAARLINNFKRSWLQFFLAILRRDRTYCICSTICATRFARRQILQHFVTCSMIVLICLRLKFVSIHVLYLLKLGNRTRSVIIIGFRLINLLIIVIWFSSLRLIIAWVIMLGHYILILVLTLNLHVIPRYDLIRSYCHRWLPLIDHVYQTFLTLIFLVTLA